MLIPLLVVASLASTSLGLHHLVVAARSSLEIILPRQTTSGPCTTICSPIQSTIANCTTTSCLCTASVAASLQACINCAIAVDPSVSVVSAAQSLIDTFATTCSTVTGLPSVTIATGTAPSTPNTSGGSVAISTSTIIVIPTTISQIIIRPSSTPSATSTSPTTSTSNAGSTGGLPLKSSASSGRVILSWTGALLGLAAGNLLVF